MAADGHPEGRRCGGGDGGPPDHYSLLGLPRSANDAAIRSAYRRLALLTHPDKGGSESSFCSISTAFDTLISPARRRSYDAFLAGGAAKEAGSGRGAQPREEGLAAAPTRREKALLKLKAAISEAPKDQRREVLASLPSRVSQTLLAWMQSADSSQNGQTSSAPAGQEPDKLCAGAREADGQSEGSDVESTDTASTLVLHPGDGSNQHSRNGNLQGIKRAGGDSQLYTVNICCLNLLITSRNVDRLEDALHLRMALVLMKNTLTDERKKLELLCPRKLKEKFTSITQAACKMVGITTGDLRISLSPWVSAVSEIGQKIYGHKTEDVGAALEQRAQLLAAKAAGWPQLRAVWIGILSESRGSCGAEAMADAAWIAQAPKRAAIEARGRKRPLPQQLPLQCQDPQKRRERELSSAVKEVEKVLDAEDRSAVAVAKAKAVAQQRAEREEKRARVDRLRWASDRSRTTKELLAGPPPPELEARRASSSQAAGRTTNASLAGPLKALQPRWGSGSQPGARASR